MGRQLMGRTLCKNGFAVSTVGFPGLGQTGGDYETAMWSKTGEIEVVRRYEEPSDALMGHIEFVAANGGRSLLDLFF